MKKVFTSILTLATLPLFAQVVIDQSNFTRTAGVVDAGVQADATGVVAPTEGDNQTWDYSGLVAGNTFTIPWTDASGDPDYPTALNYREVNLSFQVFPITGREYEAVDADGWYDQGRVLEEATHSITAISGGADDVLHFPDQVQEYDGRMNFLDFPVSYQSSWTQSYTEYTQFELTVAAFGLNNTPGEQKRIRTQSRNVVGQGQLTIPDENGDPSGPLDALLIKVEATVVDSFFLAGDEAPEALLSSFQLTQGATSTEEFYVFYVEGFYHAVMNVNLDEEGEVASVFYRPAAAALATSIGNLTDNEVGVYPNPVAAGEVITIAGNSVAVTAEMIDMTGRMVFSTAIPANAGNARINLPADMVPGVYSLVQRGSDAAPVSTGKVIVR